MELDIIPKKTVRRLTTSRSVSVCEYSSVGMKNRQIYCPDKRKKRKKNHIKDPCQDEPLGNRCDFVHEARVIAVKATSKSVSWSLVQPFLVSSHFVFPI